MVVLVPAPSHRASRDVCLGETIGHAHPAEIVTDADARETGVHGRSVLRGLGDARAVDACRHRSRCRLGRTGLLCGTLLVAPHSRPVSQVVCHWTSLGSRCLPRNDRPRRWCNALPLARQTMQVAYRHPLLALRKFLTFNPPPSGLHSLRMIRFRSARPQELFAVHAHLDASRPYDERMRIAFDGRHPQIDEDAADEPRPLRRSQDNDPFTTLRPSSRCTAASDACQSGKTRYTRHSLAVCASPARWDTNCAHHFVFSDAPRAQTRLVHATALVRADGVRVARIIDATGSHASGSTPPANLGPIRRDHFRRFSTDFMCFSRPPTEHLASRPRLAPY